MLILNENSEIIWKILSEYKGSKSTFPEFSLNCDSNNSTI